jgi:GT2 family glycosyltransferase
MALLSLERLLFLEMMKMAWVHYWQGGWVVAAAVLVRRQAVQKTGGWDESLQAAQDRDFMIRSR